MIDTIRQITVGYGIDRVLRRYLVVISIIVSVLVGAILGRFFKVLVLIPAFALILTAVLGRAIYFEHGLLRPAWEFAVLIMSLQIGYVAIPISYVVMASLSRIKTDIHQIAAEWFANLPRFRVSDNPAPLARPVDGDGTSRRLAER